MHFCQPAYSVGPYRSGYPQHPENGMKSLVLAAALLGAAASANAATAIWTGRQEQVQTVTYQWVWRCEYNYLGKTFWKLYQSGCPASVEVM